jgi:hypothetical protein
MDAVYVRIVAISEILIVRLNKHSWKDRRKNPLIIENIV